MVADQVFLSPQRLFKIHVTKHLKMTSSIHDTKSITDIYIIDENDHNFSATDWIRKVKAELYGNGISLDHLFGTPAGLHPSPVPLILSQIEVPAFPGRAAIIADLLAVPPVIGVPAEPARLAVPPIRGNTEHSAIRATEIKEWDKNNRFAWHYLSKCCPSTTGAYEYLKKIEQGDVPDAYLSI